MAAKKITLPAPVGEVTLVPKETEISEAPKYVSVKEMCEAGILQEINRQLLHPLGMALEVTGDHIVGILDRRDDPEGMLFTEINAQKTWNFEHRFKDACKLRRTTLKFDVQPAYPKVERPDIQQGRIFRGKNAKWIDRHGFNDRVVIWTDGTTVQYNSYEVAVGRPYPKVKMSVFLGWVKFEVVD